MSKPKKKPQRWRFLWDNDGHTYLVKDEQAELFSDLLDGGENTETEFMQNFDDCRTGYHPSGYSFTDPEMD